jgi:CreA protein
MSTFTRWCHALALAGAAQMGLLAPTLAADEPDLIFKRSTVFKWLTPNDKLATYGIDDPEVDGVACHFTVPERGGLSGWIGVAERSRTSSVEIT